MYGSLVFRSIWISAGLLALAGCAAQPNEAASTASIPPLQAGMARVWVLRQPTAPGGNVAACVFRTKSATHSGMKSATDSDLMSAIPI